MKKAALQLLFAMFILGPILSYAHRPDRSLIYLRIYESDGVEGRFEICVNELNNYLGTDLPKHPTVEEARKYETVMQDYVLNNAAFTSEFGAHDISFTGEISILKVNFGSFVRLHFRLNNVQQIPDEMDVTYSVFLDENPRHTNVLGIEYNWKSGLFNNEAIIALDFDTDNRTKTLSLADTSIWKGFMAMVRQGVWHIWIGFDHILFLIALILPSVVRRNRGSKNVASIGAQAARLKNWGWVPVAKFKPAFWYIVKVITFFTIAHTITLSLASLNIVNLPSRFVESMIAASIGLAAYHNIQPIFKGRDWIIAFGFGLFHGFGFATVLSELGFTGEFLTLSLLGFNLGVEIGQVVIIALIFPILYLIRNIRWYPRVLVYISAVLILISMYWLIERAFDIDMVLDERIMRAGGDLLRWLGLR